MNQLLSNFKTSNGLQVIHILKPQSMSVSLSLRVTAGSIYEMNDEVGIAHFLEHVVFDGTQKYPDGKDLLNLIEEKGAQWNGWTNKETVEYPVKMLKEDIETAFEYLSQIMLYPLITKLDIEKEKKVIEQEINRDEANPERVSFHLIYRALFPATRVGATNIGSIEDIKKIERQKIISYMDKHYNAQNMVLVVCGSFDEKNAEKLSEKYFGTLKRGEKTGEVSVDVASIKDPLIENRNLQQSNISLGYKGFHVSDRRRYVAEIIRYILVEGKASRLKQEIREKKALAYTLAVSHSYSRNNPIFTIRVGLSKDKIEECLTITKAEIEKMKKVKIPNPELVRAYNLIKADLAFDFENTLREASHYSNLFCLTGEIKTVEKELSIYQEIINDPDFVMKTAQELFADDPAISILS